MTSMEVDQPTTFSAHALGGLSDKLGYDNFVGIVSGGLGSLDFFHLLQTLCAEIKVLDELDESPSAIQSLKDSKIFLYELSAFLTELDCGINELLSGALEDRFSTETRCYALVNFLLNELKVARLLANRKLQEPTKVDDSIIAQDLGKALKTLRVPAPKAGEEKHIIRKIMVEAEKRCRTMRNPPRPLFREKVDDLKWANVDQLCHHLAVDVRSRNLLLLKRIDVTINSFLWSDKVRKREKEILALYAGKRQAMAKVKTPDVISLLACSDDHLLIERASCSRLREHTKSRVQPSANVEAPKDRGGRTGEITAPTQETFHSQQHDRGHGGHGRGQGRQDRGGGGQQWSSRGGGGYGGGRGGGHHRGNNYNTRSFEDQMKILTEDILNMKARNEYQERHENRGGGHQRGRGDRRGRGGGGYNRY